MFRRMNVPVIGIVQVGYQSMADRYTYIPSLGILVAMVWAGHELVVRRMGLMRPMGLLTGSAIAVCALLTFVQLQHWRNSVTLLRRAVSVEPRNFVARVMLGNVLFEGRQLEAALLVVDDGLHLGFFLAGPLQGRRPQFLQEGHDRGRVLGHVLLEDEIGVALVAEQQRPLRPLRHKHIFLQDVADLP